jgi:hypothetical protein
MRADPVVGDLGHLQAPAAHVADQSARAVEAGNDAQRGVMRLFRAGQHAHREPCLLRDRSDQPIPVRCTADGLSGDDVDAGDAHGIGDGAEPAHCLDRATAALRGEFAGLVEADTEPAQ